jgi:hypothetical protein
MFFRGVLAALTHCLQWENQFNHYYELVVKGDCKPVIEVLNGTTGRYALSGFYDKAKDLEHRLKTERRVVVRYEYIPRTEEIYQNIDQCAKRVRNLIEQRFRIR